VSAEHVPLTRRRVLDQLERHDDQRHQEVGHRQVEDVVVGHRAHVPVARYRPDDHEVADHRQHDNDDVEHDEAGVNPPNLREVLVRIIRVGKACVNAVVDARRRRILVRGGRHGSEETDVCRDEVDRRRGRRQRQQKAVNNVRLEDYRHDDLYFTSVVKIPLRDVSQLSLI